MARERSIDTARSNGRAPDPGVSIAELRQLIALMQHSDIEEITIEREAADLKLTLKKPDVAVPALGRLPTELDITDADPHTGQAATDEERFIPIPAPLVGRFYQGVKPGAKPLAAVGDIVRVGQVVGSIETLNVFNEVEATVAGRIVDLQAHDGQAVEYGQPLFVVERSGS